MAKWWRGLRSVASSSFNRSIRCFHHYETIQAIPREATGRRVSARDRTIGRIPAVVFPQSPDASPSRKQLLTADRKQIKSILDSIHRDEESGKILNLVFVWANDGEHLKVDVPLVFKGLDNCPGLKKGGNLQSMRSSLKLVGRAEHMPSKIEVDVSKLDIEDKVLVQEVVFHP